MRSTHEVTNQSTPLVGYNTASYPALREGVQRAGAAWALPEIDELGTLAGSAEAQEWGRLAERNEPALRTHDRYGHRIDEVEYDASYHRLMDVAVSHGLHAAPWADDRPGAHVARAAKMSAWSVDAGHGCPISMTYAVVPALRANPELAQRFEAKLTARVYDFGLRDPDTKAGLIAGMSMTEKQGGSDVRSNTTVATPQSDGSYSLVGHKWFTSAPMSDFFLTLAQAPGGLSCFLVPRVLAGGDRNAIELMRLKDKLGNRSNASSEIEYDGAQGWLVGDEGRGVRTIVEMVNMTRLDCVIGSATGMRTGVTAAAHHARQRSAFGKPLVDQPAMLGVLADLQVEAEAATAAMMRLAAAHDNAVRGDDAEAGLLRIGLAATKYYVCKRGPMHAAEALECLGGNGYIEESDMPRLYREMPLLSIWEGSGNVAALDTLRAMANEPHTLDLFFAEVEQAEGLDRRFDEALTRLKKEFTSFDDIELRARRIVEQLALVLQGSLLLTQESSAVSDAFCASRLDRDWGGAFGTLPTGLDLEAIVDRVG